MRYYKLRVILSLIFLGIFGAISQTFFSSVGIANKCATSLKSIFRNFFSIGSGNRLFILKNYGASLLRFGDAQRWAMTDRYLLNDESINWSGFVGYGVGISSFNLVLIERFKQLW